MEEIKKNIIPPKTHSTKEMFNWYKKKYPSTKITYWMFKEVIARFNKKASNAVIFGQELNLGSKLGQIIIKKISRNYQKPVVNWGASNKNKKDLIAKGVQPKDDDHPDGELWMVYYSDAWYLRWAWSRKSSKVKNHTVYKFVPTSNKSKTAGDNSLEKLGNKGMLTLANKLNPVLHYVYSQPKKEEV